jgi:transaldolase
MADTKLDTGNAVAASDASSNPLVALVAQGQSIWLDYITRDLVRGGELQQLIEAHGLRGMTSNPTIFEKAMASGHAYDEQLTAVAREHSEPGAIFEALAVQDIRDACELFRPLYDQTKGADGFVSIEVSPRLAADSEATLVEARRLWQTVARPNVMIKVPGTDACIPAIRQLLREGVNVNVTLLFAREKHERVMQAYIEALEERASAGEPVERIASVASFFVSRVDTLVDKLIGQRIAATADASEQERLRGLLGKAAIANAKLAYKRFRELFDSPRFGALKARGAQVQRPLWASTSTKNPDYRDVIYIESLIGPDTVNTVPQPTLLAFMDHGQVRRTIDEGAADAEATMAQLAAVGIDMDAVTSQLEREGIDSFAASYDDLIAGIDQKRQQLKR